MKFGLLGFCAIFLLLHQLESSFCYTGVFEVDRNGVGRVPPSEQLELTPLRNYLLLAEFQFVSADLMDKNTTFGGIEVANYAQTPRSFHHLFSRFPYVEHIEITITQGSWDTGRWGAPPRASYGPLGVYMRILFKKSRIQELRDEELLLVSYVRDLFSCTTSRGRDSHAHISERGAYELVFPREGTCTENLVKSLGYVQGRGKGGLSGLLNARVFYKTLYNSITAKLTVENGLLVAKQGYAVVLPKELFKRGRWTFPDMFSPKNEKFVFNKLASVTNSTLKFNGGEKFRIKATANEMADRDGIIQLKSLEKVKFVESEFSVRDSGNEGIPLSIVRKISQYGSAGGIVATFIRNNNSETGIRIESKDFISQHIIYYLHTLEASLTPIMGTDACSSEECILLGKEQPLELNPSIKNDGVFSFELVIPPRSMLMYRFQFESKMLHINEYETDVERGAILAGSIVEYDVEGTHGTSRLFSLHKVVVIPLPDFSMYFNVIIATCTVMTLFFGNFIWYFTAKEA